MGSPRRRDRDGARPSHFPCPPVNPSRVSLQSHHGEKETDLRGLLFHLEHLVVELALLGREVAARERRHAAHGHHADHSFAESPLGIERLLDVREQIGRAALLLGVGHEVRLLARQLQVKESTLAYFRRNRSAC